MEIKIFNGEQILLSNEFLKGDFEGRNSHTSYLNEFKIKDGNVSLNSDFLFRLICYKNLYVKLKGKYKSNLDCFGGVGITAKIFSDSNSETFVNDIDENCLKILSDNFQNVLNVDCFNFKLGRKFDLVLADFNDFTISKFINKKEYFDALKNILDHSNKYVIINDCSVFYLKYGVKSFEVYSKLLNSEIKSFEDLFTAEKKYFENEFKEWKVICIEYFHNSSFILFEKSGSNDFEFNRVISNKEKVIECML